MHQFHLIDTFAAAIRFFFSKKSSRSMAAALEGKTYDLKSAYRQVPIRADHLKFAYFSIYNWEVDAVEIYRLKTLPFGATHSVYNFLRLARMLYTILVKGLFLITTNFYDDFILASPPSLRDSSANSMELVFMLTGWIFAREGKKSTTFSAVCKALGVQFDFCESDKYLMHVENTEARKKEVRDLIGLALKNRRLSKPESLILRGKLGFADSFMHGRLGAVVLKKLAEHAYGRSATLEPDLIAALQSMIVRLDTSVPRTVASSEDRCWHIFTDAAYEPNTSSGGLGGVCFGDDTCVQSWFGISVSDSQSKILGAVHKQSLIYELELIAAVVAMRLWGGNGLSNLHVCYGDNDSVRFSLIRAVGTGDIAFAIMRSHLEWEAESNCQAWFARVPTEANIADHPSQLQKVDVLTDELCCNNKAESILNWLLEKVKEVKPH